MLNVELLLARNQKRETRSEKPEARNQKLEARSQTPEARNQKLEAQKLEAQKLIPNQSLAFYF